MLAAAVQAAVGHGTSTLHRGSDCQPPAAGLLMHCSISISLGLVQPEALSLALGSAAPFPRE